MQIQAFQSIEPLLKETHQVSLACPIPNDQALVLTHNIQLNSHYFGNPTWAMDYLSHVHRYPGFKVLWQSAIDSLDNKIVIDIGCGPGNLYAILGGNPKCLIGVDIAEGSLRIAQELGYLPLLADAHSLPFKSEVADVVMLNAALHHFDNMETCLVEAARLVRPGGLLVIDHDPQLEAWYWRGPTRWFYGIRHHIYRYILRDLHWEENERVHALATEVHHRPGHGLTSELLQDTLKPIGFEVNLYPHNQVAGAEVLKGVPGAYPHWRYPVGQILSGINPFSPKAALSLFCVARRSSI